MILRAVLVLAAASFLCAAADETVFVGQPEVRIDSTGVDTKKSEFKSQAKCVIVKRGRGYIWASRDNRKLTRVESGDYVYYISPEGSGYVKVLKASASTGGWDYMEHLTVGFATVTYWGRASAE